MQFKAVLALASGLSAITAWTIPANQPEGIYEVSTDASGVSNHTLIALIDATFVPRGMSIKRGNLKRTLQGSNAVGCGGNGFFNAQADSAVQGLKNQCVGGPTGGGAVGGNRDFYSIAGEGTSQVVAYFCNFSSKQNTCYADEVADAIQQRISGACGQYQSGWDVVIDRAAQYGYEVASANFCGRGTSG